MRQFFSNRTKSAIPATLIFLVFWFFPHHALCAYTYKDIHPPGWTESRVVCLNGQGDAVGYGVSRSGERGFLWASGTIVEILPPGADSARAAWINGRGDVAGTAVVGGVPRAFLLRDGQYLDPAPGWGYSEATYLGEDGSVAGSGEFGAFVSRNGVTEILPGFATVLAGNSSGQLVGKSGNSAYLYRPGVGYLSLNPPQTTSAAPRGINENGRVAISSLKDGVDKGFVYSDPFFVSMTPSGWISSHATAINNLEMVAGYGDSPEGKRSFLRTGASYEIIAFPGWTSTEALSVNDLGQVAGSGSTASGETHAFLAFPPGVTAQGGGGGSSGGGCSVASRGPGGGPSRSASADLLVMGSPLLLLLWRRAGAARVRSPRARGSRSGPEGM